VIETVGTFAMTLSLALLLLPVLPVPRWIFPRDGRHVKNPGLEDCFP
jgi:hypothetical protein